MAPSRHHSQDHVERPLRSCRAQAARVHSIMLSALCRSSVLQLEPETRVWCHIRLKRKCYRGLCWAENCVWHGAWINYIATRDNILRVFPCRTLHNWSVRPFKFRVHDLYRPTVQPRIVRRKLRGTLSRRSLIGISVPAIKYRSEMSQLKGLCHYYPYFEISASNTQVNIALYILALCKPWPCLMRGSSRCLNELFR